MNKDWWWKFIDNLSLGTSFRMDLDHLARRQVDEDDASKGTLGFLTERGLAQRAVHLLPFFQHIWVKCGEQGVVAIMHIPADKAPSSGFANQASNLARRCVVAHGMKGDIVVVKHFPALKVETVENVTGAGDSFVGTLIAGIASDKKSIYDLDGLESIVNTAQHAAVLSLQSHHAVSPRLSDLKSL
jgi:pseudouridine-5'-phosphate glycosidase/pseudouridine kinase